MYTEEQWRTILSEIAYIVNNRPLYASSNEIWEQPPITPNDLIIGHHFQPPQPGPQDRVDPRHLNRCCQKRADEFWQCWLKYFAPNLLPRNKWYRPRENIQPGDVVLEIDSKHKRCQWTLAQIVEAYPGEDGLVRKVRLRTNKSQYDRPIHKLCLIATKEELSGNQS